MRLLTFATLLVGTASVVICTVAQAAPPLRVTLHYDVSRNGTVMVGAVETLKHDGHSYSIESQWEGKGLLALSTRGKATRSSVGNIGARGLAPIEFRDKRGDGPLAVARFNWAKKLLIRERDGRTKSEPLPEGAQDRLTFAYGFAFAPPASGAVEFSVNVADTRGLSRNRYAIAGRETLKTEAGEFEALKVVKQREPGDSRETEIWFALKRDYLPLRVLVIEKDGTRLDQVVTRIES
ncbi:MAG: hypothetical protein A3G25_04540 [Betaproteobacteria bacterium RIFCSPLOWO2_12_FULL_63_13]|nr:MAG: hypothetical protein A3H32_10285 [Betaproteobacteria bacterium RIFCSPLOWO2_02_FULL_63_19]OGA45514.1 MAG: hypothetical protein A3G25_04540 [Betaproteobacteria bacterium RIFCSPLOWO2_12_FULL_63_13]